MADQRWERACPQTHCGSMHACDLGQVAEWLCGVSNPKLVPTHNAIEGLFPAATDNTYPGCI